MPYTPYRAPVRRNASRYAQCRVRKRSNECVSEKRLVKSQRSGVALTERGGSWGPRRFLHLFRAGAGTISNSLAFTFVRLHANTHRLFFRAGAGTVSNSLAFTFVRLHGKPYRLPVRLHANTHRLFFRAGAGTTSNSLAFTFVRLHRKPYRLFFERELEWSVRAFACKQQLVRIHANTHR